MTDLEIAMSKEGSSNNQTDLQRDMSNAKQQQQAQPQAPVEAPGILDRVIEGIGTARAQFNKNIVSPIGELTGMFTPDERIAHDQLADKSLAEGKAMNKLYKDAEGKDSWNVAQTIGEYAPDIAVGVLSKAKALGSGLYEGGLEYSRTGDIGSAVKAGAIATVGGAAVNKAIDAYSVGKKSKIDKAIDYFKTEKKTAFGKGIDNLPTQSKDAMNETIDNMDRLNIKNMDTEAVGKVIDDIGLNKPTGEVSENVTSRLTQQKNRAQLLKNKEYKVADELADTTGSVDVSSNLSKSVTDADGKILKTKDMTVDELDAYSNIEKLVTREPNITAKGIESRIQELSKEAYKPSNTSVKYMYDRSIEGLRKQQDELLNEKGISGVYDKARKADQEYKRRYLGTVDGYGSKAGKKVGNVLKEGNKSDVSSAILGETFDQNVAQQVKREFGKEQRAEMVSDVLSKGIDKDKLNTAEGVRTLISNYGKANIEGLKQMLGTKGYTQLKNNMDSLALIQSTIESAGKMDTGLAKDILNLAAAAAASKISPYASMHVAINSAKNIAGKGFRSKKIGLIKRVEKMPDSNYKTKLLKGLKTMIPATSGAVAGE